MRGEWVYKPNYVAVVSRLTTYANAYERTNNSDSVALAGLAGVFWDGTSGILAEIGRVCKLL